jgi:hypothetical protein
MERGELRRILEEVLAKASADSDSDVELNIEVNEQNRDDLLLADELTEVISDEAGDKGDTQNADNARFEFLTWPEIKRDIFYGGLLGAAGLLVRLLIGG